MSGVLSSYWLSIWGFVLTLSLGSNPQSLVLEVVEESTPFFAKDFPPTNSLVYRSILFAGFLFPWKLKERNFITISWHALASRSMDVRESDFICQDTFWSSITVRKMCFTYSRISQLSWSNFIWFAPLSGCKPLSKPYGLPKEESNPIVVPKSSRP